MSNNTHWICLYLVFQPQIQASLDCTHEAWNHHQIQTVHHCTPIAMFELSQEEAIDRGYWTGDPEDDVEAVDEFYGEDFEGRVPMAAAEAENDDDKAATFLDADEEIVDAHNKMEGFDLLEDDDNWGIEVFCRAVLHLASHNWSNFKTQSAEYQYLYIAATEGADLVQGADL